MLGQKEDVRRKAERLLLIGLILLGFMSLSLPASASGNGISGVSGKSGSTCTMCHSSGTSATVTLTGPASLSSGASGSYTLTVTGISGNGGLDVAASNGSFTAGAGTKVMNGEIVHTTGVPGTSKSWTFTYAAPTVASNSSVTLFGAAIDSFSGSTGKVQMMVNVTAPAPVVSVSISPTSASLLTGGTQQFAATVSGSSTTAVTWSATGGSVSGSGLYTAPSTAGSYTVKATSVADTTKSASATVTVTAPAPVVSVSISPTSASLLTNATQQFAATVTGSSTTAVTWSATGGSVSSSGLYTAPSTAGSYTVKATSAADISKSASATVTVTAPAPVVSVSISPISASLLTSATQQFAATVTGSSNTTVTWSATGGSVSASGLYTAPSTAGSYTVKATSVADMTKSASATVTVTAATMPTMLVSPNSLAFSYSSGGTAPAALPAPKTINVSSSGSQFNYSYASDSTWLMASGSGTTAGTASVSVNPAGLAAGTYNGKVMVNSTGASNSPQTIAVTLTVTSAQPPPPPPSPGGDLVVNPSRLVFYAEGHNPPAAKTISVKSSTGSAMNFTAAVHGGHWLSISPSGGATPGSITVSAYTTGMTAGTYSCVIRITSGTSTRRVSVLLVISRSEDDGGSGDDAAARPFTFDPGATGAARAGWLAGAGAQVNSSNTAANQGLVLSKSKSAPATAIAGVAIKGAAGAQLTQLGFDLQAGSECTAQAPQFVVITLDDVVHTANCASGQVKPSPAVGWSRVRFNPADAAQLTPPVRPGTEVKTIALVMDHIAGTGVAVLDNISINGTMVGKNTD